MGNDLSAVKTKVSNLETVKWKLGGYSQASETTGWASIPNVRNILNNCDDIFIFCALDGNNKFALNIPSSILKVATVNYTFRLGDNLSGVWVLYAPNNENGLLQISRADMGSINYVNSAYLECWYK